MRKRTGTRCLAIAGLLIVLGRASTPAFAQDKPLAGLLLDMRGSGIADATLFIVPVVRPRLSAEIQADLRGRPAAGEAGSRVIRSAPDGSFSALLPAGRYRIAAFKPGFEVALSEVNLLARNRITLIMNPEQDPPGGPAGAGDGQGDLDWILRQPDGNNLRERTLDLAGLIAQNAPAAQPAAFWARMPPIDGEFVQHLSGGSLLGGEATGPGDSSGRSTRLALRGPAGSQGSWSFDGLDGRSSTAVDSGGDSRRARRSTGLGVGLDYRLGPSDGLQAEMRYGSSRFLLGAPWSQDGIDQEQKTAGVRALWNRRLGDESSLRVGASYLEAGVREPSAVAGSRTAPAAAGADLDGQSDRSIGATAGVAFKAAAHDVGLSLRVHAYRYDLGDGGAFLSSLDVGPAALEAGGEGSALSLSGQDDWRVAERSVVQYGLGYHTDRAAGSSYLVPRVGMTCALSAAGDLFLRSALLYRIDDRVPPGPDGPGAGRAGEASPGSRNLGYEIGVTRRLENRLHFAATLSYTPFQGFGGGDESTSPVFQDEGVPVLADAGAGRHEMEFEVGRGFGFVHGSLAGSLGRVEGRLSPLVQESPLNSLKAGEARYYLTSLRAQFQPTDTELRIDYRRVTGSMQPAVLAGDGDLDYRRLDLAVYQDLPWVVIANSRWRVLMAYQGLQYDSLDDPDLPDSGATSRITGGVDISF
jgi:hypothetical protein